MNLKLRVVSSLVVLLCQSQYALAAPLLLPVSIDPVFTMSTQIGKVFHDRNGNGYQDYYEEGIPGVRLVSVTGLLIETDGYGRFHIAETSVQKLHSGQNFIIKLDTSSLPQGANLTTENPRVVRNLSASMNKINFGIQF